MIRSLLVALDDSPRARTVMRVAGELARAFDARVFLFRIVDVPHEFPPAAHVRRDELEDILIERAREAVVALAFQFPEAIVEVVADSGNAPWRLVIEKAERVDVDVIVIGSHGFGGLDRFFGTNAARIADRAHRHVFVVHDREGS